MTEVRKLRQCRRLMAVVLLVAGGVGVTLGEAMLRSVSAAAI